MSIEFKGVQKRDRFIETRNLVDGQSPIDSEWWKRKVNQPPANLEFRRSISVNSPAKEGEWPHAKTIDRPQTRKIYDSVSHYAG